MVLGPVRFSPLAVAALLFTAACADAPITAADIQADGQLRQADSSSQQSVHAASEREPKAQRAEHLRVTGLLAAQADGPLEDATRFSRESESIYLHLRADDLSEPRPVTFVWLHSGAWGEHRRETMGFLQPAETISLAASLPLARYFKEQAEGEPAAELAPEQLAGTWKVEVYSTDTNGRSLVFERDFEVVEPEDYEAWVLAEASAGVSH